jgi:hypothetical protein
MSSHQGRAIHATQMFLRTQQGLCHCSRTTALTFIDHEEDGQGFVKHHQDQGVRHFLFSEFWTSLSIGV